MIFNVIGLVIGLLIFGAGIYFFAKNRADNESRKIYGITTGIGAIITISIIIRMLTYML